MSEASILSYGPCAEQDTPLDEKCIRKKLRCLRFAVGCSCVLSMLSVAFVVLLMLQVTTLKTSQLAETEYSHNSSRHETDTPRYEFLQDTTSNAKISGTFKIEQNVLQKHGVVRWTSDETSIIEPQTGTECLKIPVAGKYLVISRFTFLVPPSNSSTMIIHYFSIKTSTGVVKQFAYRRKYVSLMESKLNTGLEMRKASVFIEFYDLQANEQICASTSSPELLYASSLDNDVNIIRV